MAANVKATLTRDFTSTAASWIGEASGTLPGSAERLVLLLTMRAYAAGQTRTLIVKWEGVPVTVRQTSLLGTITQQEDFHYWIGTLDNPPLTGKTVDVDASGSIRGMLATLFFVEAVDDTVPIIVHDFQDRDVSGNSVTLNGTPARAGSVIVSANGLNPASTVTSFTPNGWSTAFSGTATGGGNQTTAIRYTQAASTAAVETTAQFGTSDVNRGGVLFEIQTAVSAGVGVTESVSPSDSIGAPIVAVSVGLTEALTASDSSSASIPADTPAANPPGVWTGAAASWKLPSGLDSKGGGALTVSGLSAATIKGPGATFTTSSFARRTAPGLGALADLTPEFWVKPTAFGHLFYLGPRATGTSVARIWIDAAGAWNVLRTIGAATQSAKSADGAAVLGSTYHVVGVFDSGNNHRLTINGETVTLTMTGAAVTGSNSIGSDDEIALGDPTLASLVGFAGDMGRVTLWPFAMSAGRAKASYRQQNNLAQWVGISGENASSDTNRAPTAVPVQEALTSGVAKTIPVISRAYDPDGDALSIQAGSVVPSNGTASIVSDQVVWTPAPSFVGSAACDFALRDGGGKSSASKIYATVAAPTGIVDRPKRPFGFTSWTSVPVSRIRPVGFGVTGAPGPAGGYTSLANAYAAAVGGDFIVLADGAYAEDFDFNRDLPAANPVVITSRNVTNGRSPMANFTGLYTVSGDGHWFYEVRWTRTTPSGDGVPSTYTLTVSASNITITRNWFNTPNGMNITDGDRSNINIGWNRFVTSADRIGAFIFIRVANNLILPTSKFRSSALYNNYFNKTVPSLNGNDAYNVYMGTEHAKPNTSAVVSEVYIEYNYLAGGNQMKMYLKRGITSLSYNHVVGGGQFGFRHGTVRYASPSSLNTKDYPTGKAYGNRVIGANFTVAGAGCDIRGNYLDNSQGFIIFPGSENDPARSTRGETQAASDALFVGNYVDRSSDAFAPYNFGYIDQADDVLFEGGGGRIRNCNIWGHTGDAPIQKTGSKAAGNIIYNAGFVDASTVTIHAGTGSYTVPATITLNPDTDVGFQVANQNLTT